RFVDRILTKTEQKKGLASFAKRYAAKEACLKALGTGMRKGLSWHDMVISNDKLGRPLLTLKGGAAAQLKKLAGSKKARIHLTLSDEAPYALAVVIIEI
ncbi:MAG: holo-ACP synthase, partial [Dongiaceae bacterium]